MRPVTAESASGISANAATPARTAHRTAAGAPISPSANQTPAATSSPGTANAAAPASPSALKARTARRVSAGLISPSPAAPAGRRAPQWAHAADPAVASRGAPQAGQAVGGAGASGTGAFRRGFGQTNAARPVRFKRVPEMPALSRRAFHAAAAAAALARPAAADGPGERGPQFPRMLQRFYEAKLAAHAARVRAELDAVDSPESAAAHAADLRNRIAARFGPKPPRTPLNARVAGTLDRGTYRVERLTYESRPGLLVAANLYIPAGDGPHPGVLGLCGHSRLGKAEPKYQAFAVELAAAGFATLVIDPIGQGERVQWPDGKGSSLFGGPTGEHNQLDSLMRPAGQWFGAWRAWDGVRGIDYLESRGDVSTAPFLGVTGNSGGGTLTCLVAGWDARVSAAAPGCFVTTFARNLRNELPADAEQCPPGALAAGLDHHSFLVPTLLGEGRGGEPGTVAVLAKRADFFDIRGTREAFGRLAYISQAAGLPARHATLTVAPGVHGYDPPLRRAMVEAFCGAAGRPVPPPFTFDRPEPPEALFATPAGSVAEAGSIPVWKLLRDDLPEPTARPVTAAAVRAALNLGETPADPPAFDLSPWRSARGLPSSHASRYAVHSEPHVTVPVLRLQGERMDGPPPVTARPALLLVAHRGADAAFGPADEGDPRTSQFARSLPGRFPGAVIYGCDVRGTGATEPGTVGPGEASNPYGSNYMYAAHARMLGESTLAGRVRDALAAWRFVAASHTGALHLAGDRWGAIPALLTAVLLLEERVPATLTLTGLPESWRALVEDDHANWPVALLPHGVLAHFDLPDALAAVRGSLGGRLTVEDRASTRDGAA